MDTEKLELKRRRLRVGDPEFMPPDGGWGWLVVLACGFSNLCNFPMFQQFGLVFRQRFHDLGISNTETTTVININQAFNSCSGLLNGPIYRSFTYRQVAIFGSILVASALFATTFCHSFYTYIIFYSICYGSGIGITQGANAVALNTFFKDKRRIATGFSWTTTALGPIVWPYVITFFLDVYSMEGTLLIFAAFSLHSLMCSLLLQPVEWHTKFKDEVEVQEEEKAFLGSKLTQKSKSRSVFSSQYLYNEDDPNEPGYEIIDRGYPMMVRANDGWYSQKNSLNGSRTSLTSNRTKGPSRYPSGQNSVAMSKRASYNNLSEAKRKRGNIIREEEETNETTQYYEKDVLKTAAMKLKEYQQEEEEESKKLTFFQKVCIFFDFDLFRDPIYVNLMMGITFANFVEINFSIITPMVLEEFNFGKYEIATFMSLLGATDILVRFFIPFLAEKIGWDNKTFFLVGVLSMAFGRIILIHTQTYYFGLLVAIIIGAGKGLRTIFIALVIPSHVHLERLPAASGLQLATGGIFFLILGPAVGWIRDLCGNYVITLHILNVMTYVTAVAWILEGYIRKRKTSPK